MGGKTIAVLATLDTKGREAQFLREQIEAMGDTALMDERGYLWYRGRSDDIMKVGER